MFKFVQQHIVFPLGEQLNGLTTNKYLNTYVNLMKAGKQEVEKYQLKKLNRILNHAYENIPYYKHVFNKHNIKISDIKHLNDLKQLPVLTREQLRGSFSKLQDNNNTYKKIYHGSSSGSTGEAVHYLQDSEGISAGKAAQHLGYRLAGYRFGHKGLHIWGNPAVVNNEWAKWSSKLKSIIYRHHKYPAYQLTEEKKFIALINTIKNENYTFIDGYTNAIYLLANYIKQHHIAFKKLKFIFTTGENLHQYQKKLIEEILGPVYDEYGCGEIMGIAYENTLYNGYAVIDPHVIVEYDYSMKNDDDSYPLIITDLDNMIMPLIRYKNGDMGVPGQHSEHLPFNTMQSVSGRVSDIVQLPGGGNLVVPSFFGSVLLKKITSIKQYQLIKESEKLITMNFVVENNQLSDNDSALIHQAMQEYLQGRIDYKIRIVDNIETEKSGKTKLLIDKTIQHQ